MRSDAAPKNGETGSVPATAGSITLTTATALAIADMIGMGVFTSLGFQVKDLPSGFAIVALWIVGGIVAFCGALCYAELATAFPRSGGEYNFLSRIYGRAVGFLAGWVSATVGFAAPVALAAMAFGQYLKGVLPGVPPLAAALALVLVVTLVHLRGVTHSSRLNNISTFVKVALMVAFIAAGLVYGTPQPVSFKPSAKDLDYITSAPFAIGLVFVMYSYSGWNAVTYIASDVKNPARTLPVSLLLAVLIVALLYVVLNAVFLYTTPIAKLAGQLDVGLVAGREIFGETGGRIVAGLICVSLVSAVSAMMWIGPRVTMVMGEDTALLAPFARKSANGTPQVAIVFQATIAAVLLLTQSFEAVIDFIQFSLTFCSFLAVLGVVVLRSTQPGLQRPYSVWGYPLPPLVFLAVTLFMMVYLVIERPAHALAGVAMMLAGLVVHALSARLPGGNAISRAVEGAKE